MQIARRQLVVALSGVAAFGHRFICISDPIVRSKPRQIERRLVLTRFLRNHLVSKDTVALQDDHLILR